MAPHEEITVELADDDPSRLRLRFIGMNEDGSDLHELRAADVASVLQGLTGFVSDMNKARVFGEERLDAEVFVRPAREGSFLLEVVQAALSDPAGAAASVGLPTIGQAIWWATRSVRAEVADYDYLDNGNVKVIWQDNTAQEIPRAAWDELNKRDRRRKKQLHEIMAPLSDDRVQALEVAQADAGFPAAGELAPPATFTLERQDYIAARPSDEVEEDENIFETEAQMSAINFDEADQWRVKTREKKKGKKATMADQAFLDSVNEGLAITKDDIFWLRIQEEIVKKNGRSTIGWRILKVVSHKRGGADDVGE